MSSFQDQSILQASFTYPHQLKSHPLEYSDYDVMLILKHHQAVIYAYSHVLSLHSIVLHEKMGEWKHNGQHHVIILSRTPEDPLSDGIDLNVIQEVISAMIDVHGFMKKSESFSYNQWVQTLIIAKELKLSLLLPLFEERAQMAIRDKYSKLIPVDDNGDTSYTISALDFLSRCGTPFIPSGVVLKDVYRMMWSCRDWSTKEVREKLTLVFPYLECMQHFMQYAISRILDVEVWIHELHQDVLKPEIRTAYDTIEIGKVSKYTYPLVQAGPRNLLYGWIHLHKETCPHCRKLETTRLAQDKAMQQEKEEEEEHTQ